MANINRFKGEWHVWWVQGFEPVLGSGWKIVIGTGELDTREPYVGEDGNVCTGFVIYEWTSEETWALYISSNERGPLVLIDGQLRWDGPDKNGQPLRIYISLAEGVSQTGPFVSLYGSTLRGDPDQVAVWGANDGPPKPKPV